MRQHTFADHGYTGMMSAVLPIVFRFPKHLAPLARRVALVGTFNGWDRDAHQLGRKPDDDWMIIVYLPPGRIVYWFDVDGTAWLDPSADGRIPNGRGSHYSVRYIRARGNGAGAY
jgi:1,4-alpha-glucan branching enzyme